MTGGVVARVILTLVHASLVVVLCGNISSAIAYFGLSCFLVVGRSFVPTGLRRVYVVASIVAIVAMTAAFREKALQDFVARSRFSGLMDFNLTFLGVSYSLLRVISALLDERRWTMGSFVRYFFFFPTFFSGPVMQPHDLDDGAGPWRWSDAAEGLARILGGIVRIGAAYLVLNFIPLGSAQQLDWSLAHWSPGALWLGMFASGFWLYLNFSGFSEVYIGLARICGVRAPENFDNPFAAADITSFWQRWHISLGNWLRSTIYAPLSRQFISWWPAFPFASAVVAPVLTMIVCGVWHAAAPAFILWGAVHGIGLAVHAVWKQKLLPRLPETLSDSALYRISSWTLTQMFVAFAWALFLPIAIPFEKRRELLLALFHAGGVI